MNHIIQNSLIAEMMIKNLLCHIWQRTGTLPQFNISFVDHFPNMKHVIITKWTKWTLITNFKIHWFQLWLILQKNPHSADAALLSCINSLWSNDDIWWYKSRSILAQVMACCMTAPSHFLNQCWLIISGDLWYLHEGNFSRNAQDIYPW